LDIYINLLSEEFVNLDRYFWEERLLGVFVYKKDQLLTHHSVTLRDAPYGFWRHTNNVTGKESIYLVIATNNFLFHTQLYMPVNQQIKLKNRNILYFHGYLEEEKQHEDFPTSLIQVL
jgi:hypothetical protein